MKLVYGIIYVIIVGASSDLIKTSWRDSPCSIHMLLKSALYNYVYLSRLLLFCGIPINGTGSDNRTPLVSSIENHSIEALKFFIDHGADTEKTDNTGKTALHHAVQQCNTDAVVYLLSVGANLEARDHQGRTPLLIAARLNHYEIARILLKGGADVQACDYAQFRSIHHAALSVHIPMVTLLMRYGALIHEKNKRGMDALMCANSVSGGETIIPYLLFVDKSHISSIQQLKMCEITGKKLKVF